jgi:hypothetical protein
MMALIILSNILIGLTLLYCLFKLKDIQEKTISIHLQMALVVFALAGIFLTFGENFLYLITSGILAFVVAEKDYKKKNGNIRMDKEQ